MIQGRESELERVRAAVATRRTVLLRGAPGMGRTILAQCVAEGHGDAVIGQSLPALSHRAYQPVLHALGWPPQSAEVASMAMTVRRHLRPEQLLVLDDLQWADPGTLELVEALDGHCAIVATVQDGARGTAAVVQLAASLAAEQVVLEPLDRQAIAEVIRRCRPDLLVGERAAVSAASGGNPLLAITLARSFDQAPQLAGGEGRAVIAGMIGRLSERDRRALVLLADAPGPVPREVLGDPDLLIDSGFVRVGSDDRLELTHQLFAESARQGLDESQSGTVCASLARLDGLSDAQRARYLLGAGDVSGALQLALAAADSPVPRAEQAASLQVAVAAAAQLLDEVDGGPLSATEYRELRIAAAAALNDSAQFDAAAEVLGDVTAYQEPQRIRAVVEVLRSTLGSGDRRTAAELLVQIDPLLETATCAHGRRARSLRSVMAGWSGDGAGLLRAAGEQMAVARAGAERSHAAMLAGLASYVNSADETAEWLTFARAEAAAHGALPSELEASRNLVMVQMSLGHHLEARSLAADCVARAEAVGDDSWAIEFRTLEVLSRFYDDAAHDDILAWLSFVRTAPVRMETRALATAVLAMALSDRGVVARSADLLEPWIRREAMLGFDPLIQAVVCWGAAQRAWMIGDLSETVRIASWITELVPAGFPTVAGTQVVWRWAEYEGGAAITAPTPAGGLLDCAELEAGSIDLLVAGEPAAAAEQFLAAAESWRPILWRCALRCWWGAGHALTLAGDTERAVEVLERVDADLDRSACPALRPRVVAALRAASGRPVRLASTPRAAEVITVQERAVLVLVAEGLRTAEIARRLGIAVSTVHSHVRSATRKLGARNRIEAAAIAATI